MQADDPPFLQVGTDVSAKYKGAFCEAKIKKVVRNIKCKVSFKGSGSGSATVNDEAIKGTLRVGNTVEVKVDHKKDAVEAIITKIQDCSQYTVVFDDGDITTLRRSALCLKSGRHFAESETLDQLPLTHPEHFGNPVIGSSRRGRRTNRTQSDDSDSETCDTSGGSGGGSGLPGSGSTPVTEKEPHTGRVVLVQCSTGDKKRSSHSCQWFPGLVVAPNAQDTVKIRVKDDYLVRSFKDGRYYTVPKKEAKEFRRHSVNPEWVGVGAAILFLDKGVLPNHWDKDILFGVQDSQSQSDDGDSDDSSDDEPREEKDHFVAQLYKFMDDKGTPLNRQPTIANRDIDLYRLFNVVQKLGGYNRVTNQNQWKNIANRLGFQPATTSVTNLCKQAYKKFLHSFEGFYRKLGVTLVAHPRGGRTTGRSLIRDRDKIHSSPAQPGSPAPGQTPPAAEDKTTEAAVKTSVIKGKEKDKDVEKENKLEKEAREKEAEAKLAQEKEAKEKEIKEKEAKEKEQQLLREKEAKEKSDREREQKEKEIKEKEAKEKEAKEKALKEKELQEANELKAKELKLKKEEKEAKEKMKEAAKVKKMKQETVNSSDEEDSGDNQPLAPLSCKPEKALSTSEKDKKAPETPKPKLLKSASAIIDGKRLDKASAKKITHRRNSLPRSNVVSGKANSDVTPLKEARGKSSSSDSSTANKKQSQDPDKPAARDPGKKAPSVSNDSDSSRGSRNGGKTPSRRNHATPPCTPGAAKPRKRKITDPPEAIQPKLISADIGDKLKVYYGPAHSESKVTYEAKVIEIEGKWPDVLMRVHYTGWNTRYDEWIKPARIADNLTQHSKGKHKDKGRRNTPNVGHGPPESPGAKKLRGALQPQQQQPPSAKPHTRNRNTNTTHPPTDPSAASESDSERESDASDIRPSKRLMEDTKTNKDKSASEPPTGSDKPQEGEKDKEKLLKSSRLGRSPQVKRSTEGTLTRVKRTRLKPEDSDTPRGRDFDLNEIRSELKGFEKTVKLPPTEPMKVDSDTTPSEEPATPIKQEKTPDKVTEDIYEFKEPEPFEFEARKSEEKKKRVPPAHRIFEELPHLKLSPTSSPDKSPTPETEKPTAKPQYNDDFDKLCQSDYHVEDSSNNSVEKEEALSMFEEIGGEDSGDRLIMSEAEDSQQPLFTHQQELFPDKTFTPIFKSFTPAKNQETYSKKDASSKLRDIEDDFTNSPLKGEQSSDEDPIDAAIQRVNAHSMSDDSNDGDLLIKTPATPTAPAGGLLATFAANATPNKSEKEPATSESKPTETKEEQVQKTKPESLSTNIIRENVSPLAVASVKKKEIENVISPTKRIISDDLTKVDLRADTENIPFVDTIVTEPPPGFNIHKEGPSIAEKVLLALSTAKKAGAAPVKEIIKKTDSLKSVRLIRNPVKPIVNLQNVLDVKVTVASNVEAQIMDVSKVQKSEVVKSEEVPKVVKKDIVERRKSVAEPTLPGKSNKVLSETIQKLSSQISQPTPAIAEYQSDKSDTDDSDDSDRRLVIDKMSEEESQSAVSLPEAPLSKIQAEKPAQTFSLRSPTHPSTNVKSPPPSESSAMREAPPKQPEEDSNISLLLCEETIPGSPAPEHLQDKSATKPRANRNLEIPFASAPSISPDQAKEQHSHKEMGREMSRECREAGAALRGERDPLGTSGLDSMDDRPASPDSSQGNMSPNRDETMSEGETASDMKMNEEESRATMMSKKMNDVEKSSSAGNLRLAPESPGGPRRGRRPRSCRVSEGDDLANLPPHTYSTRTLKYNFAVDLDTMLDCNSRITLLTLRLSEIRKAYLSEKAELAAIDRRRKKLRRKEREAVKAAKAACS